MIPGDQPLIFISYAREDGVEAQRLYDALIRIGANVWLDREHLPIGSKWKNEIARTIKAARFFVAVLSSRSITKKGFVQSEIGLALECLSEFPDNEAYLVPVRLDDCVPTHPKLMDLSWLDLFPDWELAVHKLAQAFGISTVICSGLYVSDTQIWRQNALRTFLRFYNDGVVSSCQSTGSSDEITKWFGRDHQLCTKSTYEVIDGLITFEGPGIGTTLNYKGRILGRQLQLRWHDRKSNERGVQLFRWEASTPKGSQ